MKYYLFDYMHNTVSEHKSDFPKEDLEILLDRWVRSIHNIDYQSYVGYQIDGVLTKEQLERFRISVWLEFDPNRYKDRTK